MNNTENSESSRHSYECRMATAEEASEATSVMLRAMGWSEFDELLSALPGINKGKDIQILSAGQSF